jgi:hypothetical protein
MIIGDYQNWFTSRKPWSLSLTNTVNTGTTFNTPSNAIANTHAWATAGFRGLGGYGPTRMFPGAAGMDGYGCKGGCGCPGSCGCSGLGQTTDILGLNVDPTAALVVGGLVVGLFLIFGTTAGKRAYGEKRVAAAEKRVQRLKTRYGVS